MPIAHSGETESERGGSPARRVTDDSGDDRSPEMRFTCLRRVEPVLEMLVEALQHFRPIALLVRKLGPEGVVCFSSFKLLDELLHERQLVAVFFPEMLFARLGVLKLTVFGSYSHGNERILGG